MRSLIKKLVDAVVESLTPAPKLVPIPVRTRDDRRQPRR